MFEVALVPNGFKYRELIFGFPIFFVKDLPHYLLQGGRETSSKEKPKKNKINEKKNT